MENGLTGNPADNLSSKKKKQADRRKRNTVLRWFSSFFVTAAVAVAAVNMSSTGATARIIGLDCVGTDIFYEVSVTDDNRTLTEGSLCILAESPLDKREISLQTGYSSGKFSALLPHTEYTVSVMGSAGFGKYSLDKKKIRTANTFAGRITFVALLPQTSDSGHDGTENTRYQGTVHLFYNDSRNEISAVYAEYAFLFACSGDEAAVYTRHDITAYEESFVISDLPYANGRLSVRLLAILKTGETVLLDEASACAPFVLFSSVFIYPITSTGFTVNVYPDCIAEADYTATLFLDGTAIKNLPIVSPISFSSLTRTAYFDGLSPDTTYLLEVTATCINPYTSQSETQSIFRQQVATSGISGGEILSASFNRVETGDYPMYECPVHVAYWDDQNQYLDVYMEYMFRYYGEEDPNNEYSRIEITSQDFWYTVEGISYCNGILDVRLVAQTLADELILDQKTFYTPFVAKGYTYVLPQADALSLIVYPAFMLQDDTLYTASLFSGNGLLIETRDVVMEAHEYGEVYGYVPFESLLPDTDYKIEISAWFLNPFTGEYEWQTIFSETAHTLTPTTLP